MLCDVIFLVRLQGKFEIDLSFKRCVDLVKVLSAVFTISNGNLWAFRHHE